jgi:hypothetical protein
MRLSPRRFKKSVRSASATLSRMSVRADGFGGRGSASGAASGCCSGGRRCGARVRGGGGSRLVPSRGTRHGHAIGHRALRSPCLRSKQRELMPEHDDLQLPERLRATTKQHESQQAAAHQIDERPEQEPAPRNQRDGPTTLRPTRTSHAANRVDTPLTQRRRRGLRCLPVRRVGASRARSRPLSEPPLLRTFRVARSCRRFITQTARA